MTKDTTYKFSPRLTQNRNKDSIIWMDSIQHKNITQLANAIKTRIA